MDVGWWTLDLESRVVGVGVAAVCARDVWMRDAGDGFVCACVVASHVVSV